MRPSRVGTGPDVPAGRRFSACAVALIATALAGSLAALPVDPPTPRASDAYAWELPPGFPRPAVPDVNPMSEAKVELGRWLFYDRRLSARGETACASCHRQELAFTDGRPRAIGSLGELHRYGSPSLVNIAYNASFGWASPHRRTLEHQIALPLFGDAPVEMGIVDEAVVLDRLRADAAMRGLFAAANPDGGDAIAMRDVVQALASFVRSIVAGRSPYDRYLFADDRQALTPSAQRGMELFFSPRIGCSDCHQGFTFAGDLVVEANAGRAEPVLRANGLAAPGAVVETGRLEDRGRFRVPSLRNLAWTAPYMHDGRFATLDAVLAHYAARPLDARSAAHGGGTQPFTLSAVEQEDLIAFLRSLGDPSVLTDPRFADPRSGASPEPPSLAAATRPR